MGDIQSSTFDVILQTRLVCSAVIILDGRHHTHNVVSGRLNRYPSHYNSFFASVFVEVALNACGFSFSAVGRVTTT